MLSIILPLHYIITNCLMNRFYCLLFTAYCLLFFSCGQREKSVIVPADVLPKTKMAQVITDIHMAEADIDLRTAPDAPNRDTVNFQKIFVKQHINKSQYEKSLSFYVSHPELLNDVYQEVMNELSKMQGGKITIDPPNEVK